MSQDFNGDIALIGCFASSWTPAMVRRWQADPFGFRRPWGEVPALIGAAGACYRDTGHADDVAVGIAYGSTMLRTAAQPTKFKREPAAPLENTDSTCQEALR